MNTVILLILVIASVLGGRYLNNPDGGYFAALVSIAIYVGFLLDEQAAVLKHLIGRKE